MPLRNRSQFGTTETGVIKVDYCINCYEGGKFTEPDITMEEMIEKVARTLVEQRRLPKEQALERARARVTGLKRWTKV